MGTHISTNGAQNPKANLHVGNGAVDPTTPDQDLFVEGDAEIAGTLKANVDGTISGQIEQSQVNGLSDALTAKANKSTTLTPSGAVRIDGGTSAVDLSTNRTISVANATAAAAGLMTAADFLKLFQARSTNSPTTLILRDNNNNYESGTAVTGLQVVNKNYLDSVTNARVIKSACRVVATTVLNPTGTQTVDGISLNVGDRVLCTANFPTTANGIYIVASGAWTRAEDFDSGSDIQGATIIPIVEGTVNQRTLWQLTNLPPYTIGTTAFAFTKLAVDMNAIQINQSQVNDLVDDLQEIIDDTNAGFALYASEIAERYVKADVTLYRKGNFAQEYISLTDSDSARGDQLRLALAAATTGDIIKLRAGNFDLGALLHVDIPVGVTVRGQGFERTRIYSALPQGVDSGNAILTLNNNCTLEDLWLDAYNTNSTYQIPVGTQQSIHTFTNAVLRRVRITGGTDAFFAWASGGHSMKAYDCFFESRYDTVAILKSGSNPATGGIYEFHRCHFIANGPFEGLDAEGGGPPSRIVNNFLVKSGTCLCVDCRFITTNTNASSTITTGINTIASSGAAITLVNPYFDVTGAGGTVRDINNIGLSTITVYGGMSARNSNQITSAGTVVFEPIGLYASASQDGPLSSTDWSTFNNKVATTRTISTTAPLTGGGDLSANRTLAMAAATNSVDGYLLATDHTEYETRVATLVVYDPTVDVSVGTGLCPFVVPVAFNGKDLIAIHARVITPGTTGDTTVMVTRTRSGSTVDMLSANMAINTTEYGSDTGTAGTINISNDDIASYDLIDIDVDAAQTTKAKGLIVTLTFR